MHACMHVCINYGKLVLFVMLVACKVGTWAYQPTRCSSFREFPVVCMSECCPMLVILCITPSHVLLLWHLTQQFKDVDMIMILAPGHTGEGCWCMYAGFIFRANGGYPSWPAPSFIYGIPYGNIQALGSALPLIVGIHSMITHIIIKSTHPLPSWP